MEDNKMNQMKSLLILSMLGLITLVTLPAAAQSHGNGIEITPMVGYRWGGTFTFMDWESDIEEDSAYGLVIDFPITRGLQLELLAARQSTRLYSPAGCLMCTTCYCGTGDIDITHYHVGVLYQWHTRSIDPFVVGSIGIGDIDPGDPNARDQTRFSTSVGGGFKLWFSEHLGFRLEARGIWTDTDDNGCRNDYWCDDWHDWHGDYGMVQGEFKAGVIFSF
jgi:hypothetical protein